MQLNLKTIDLILGSFDEKKNSIDERQNRI